MPLDIEHKKRLVSIGLILGFGSVVYFLTGWYYKNYISVWYYATIQNAYLPVWVTIEHCEGNAAKSKNSSATTYTANCDCFYKTKTGETIQTYFRMGEKNVKNLASLQADLDKTYPKGKEIEVLVHPHYPDLLIARYEDIRFSSWLTVTAGLLMFLVVWGPCVLVVSMGIKSLIKP